jgi:exonuclease III
LLQQANPDVICLQEIKATPEQIPLLDFELAGYPITGFLQPRKDIVAQLYLKSNLIMCFMERH